MKKLLIITAVCGLLIAIGAVAIGKRDDLRSSARRAWKEKAIAEISSRVADPAWAGKEIAELKKKGIEDPDDSDGWLSERLILMRNGDWLAYASICRKQDHRIYDFFLARGSDGQWYYSTYHFCIGALVLKIDDRSDSLAGFAKTYFLRTFDGKSNECLQKTWPPKSN